MISTSKTSPEGLTPNLHHRHASRRADRVATLNFIIHRRLTVVIAELTKTTDTASTANAALRVLRCHVLCRRIAKEQCRRATTQSRPAG
jgi:hypothetical protein